LNSVKSGYYCAVLVGGDLIVEDYFRTEDFMEGNNFLMCYESKNQDFAVTLSSSKTEGITAAATLMNVRIKEETMYYSLDKTNLPLSLAWYDTGFDEVSEITCESEVATVKQDVRRVQFNENGTAVVSFSITNAFGTFTSNELSLNCEQIITLPQAVTPFYENPWFIALYFVPVAALIAVAAVLVIKKVKSDEKGE
jgi:hypothetical protein